MGAALTQQQANAYNPFATALSGLAQNQQFGQGVSNYFQNRNIGGAGGSGIPQYQMDALSRDAFNQTAYAGGIY